MSLEASSDNIQYRSATPKSHGDMVARVWDQRLGLQNLTLVKIA